MFIYSSHTKYLYGCSLDSKERLGSGEHKESIGAFCSLVLCSVSVATQENRKGQEKSGIVTYGICLPMFSSSTSDVISDPCMPGMQD